MKRTKLLPAICVLTALMLLLSGCAHPWRIASNPNPATPMPDNGTDAPSTDVITSGEPADSAVPTETLTSEPDTAAPTDGITAEPTGMQPMNPQQTLLPAVRRTSPRRSPPQNPRKSRLRNPLRPPNLIFPRFQQRLSTTEAPMTTVCSQRQR